ncbi:MAG: aminodeoxychorismate lyase [Proteobacteria bacterium]|nr:aminodeoxychorismate lyase [Pseudomonadota bacterium]
MMLLDGQPCDSSLLLDRGLAYGDGLFETVAVRDGRLLAWDAHMARLARGCAALSLPPPEPALLRHEALALLASRSQAVIKIVVTRGSGGRGYRPPAEARPRRIVSLQAWPGDLEADVARPVSVWVCRQRLGHQPRLAGIKHLNRLEQVLASAEWPAPEYFEGLMLDIDDRVIEGIRSNVFVVRGDSLLTPDLSRCGIAGVVREAVLDIAPAHGLNPCVTDLRLEQLDASMQMFLCNSVMGLRAVERIDHGDACINLATAGTVARLGASLRVAGVVP